MWASITSLFLLKYCIRLLGLKIVGRGTLYHLGCRHGSCGHKMVRRYFKLQHDSLRLPRHNGEPKKRINFSSRFRVSQRTLLVLNFSFLYGPALMKNSKWRSPSLFHVMERWQPPLLSSTGYIMPELEYGWCPWCATYSPRTNELWSPHVERRRRRRLQLPTHGIVTPRLAGEKGFSRSPCLRP